MKKPIRFRTRTTAVILALAMLSCLLPLAGAGADTTAQVVGGWLRLRNAPSYGGRILSSYPTGSVVQITGESGSWYAVVAPDGTAGYMHRNYLRVSGGGGSSSGPAAGANAWVTSANGLNVRLRTGPSTRARIIATYAPGTQCYVQSVTGGWAYIQIGSFTGYMMSRFLTNSWTPAPTPAPAPAPAPSSGGYDVWVTSRNGRGVNFRSGPGTRYHAFGVLSVGTKATMVSYGPQWCMIQVGGQTGYMMTQYLTTTAPGSGGGSAAAGSSGYVVSANGKAVNLRTGPSKSYPVIRSFRVGTPLTVLQSYPGWYQIQISGYTGYMMDSFVQVLAAPPTTPPSPATPTDL